MKKVWMLLLALVLCAPCAQAEDAPGSWLASVLGEEMAAELALPQSKENALQQNTEGYVALLYIEGEISEYSYDYDHIGTLNAVDELIEDEKNSALMLYMNTPGGSLYEADELYHKLMTYKQETGRPVYAYMAQECCSAGVYIAMAADRIAASRMTITGSIGVYMSTYSQAGLFEKLGIESEYVATGENKVAGYPELTDAQRAIYQTLVEESFVFFKDAIAKARTLTPEQMEAFLDGRLLTALQAKEMGLIDDVLYYDEFTDVVKAAHGDAKIQDKTPEYDYGYGGLGFGGENVLEWLHRLVPDSGEDTQSGGTPAQNGGLKS